MSYSKKSVNSLGSAMGQAMLLILVCYFTLQTKVIFGKDYGSAENRVMLCYVMQ